MPIAPAQLQQVVLSLARFEINREFDPELHAEGLNYEVHPTVGISELERSDDGLRGWVQLDAKIVFTRPGAEEAAQPLPTPFDLEVRLLGFFGWSAADMPGDDLGKGWLEYNGMYLMWPYMRAYIATLTSMSALPQLTIYTMNVPTPPVLDSDDEPSGSTEAPAADVDAPLTADE